MESIAHTKAIYYPYMGHSLCHTISILGPYMAHITGFGKGQLRELMREKNYDVLAISESWLNSTTTTAEVEIDRKSVV